MLNAGTIPCASAWLVLSAKHCPFPSLLCCMRPAFCSFFTATTRIGLSFSCEPLPHRDTSATSATSATNLMGNALGGRSRRKSSIFSTSLRSVHNSNRVLVHLKYMGGMIYYLLRSLFCLVAHGPGHRRRRG